MDSLKISSISKGNNENFYIGTWSNHGLIILDENGTSINQYFPLPPDSKTGKISRTMIGEIAVDNSNKLWMPLWNIGLSTFNLVSKKFELHIPDPDNQSSLSDGQIETIMIDNSGAIWLGSARSLMNHDSEKKKFSLISNSEKSEIQSSFNEKWGLFIDSNDDLWTGSVYRGNGIDVIDLEAKSVTNHVPPNAFDERGISMWNAKEDFEGRIWGLTQYDLFVSDKSKMNFESVWKKSNVKFKDTGRIWNMMLGADKRFWIFSEKKTWWVEFLGDSINWVDASTKKANLKDVKNIGGYDRKKRSIVSNDFYLLLNMHLLEQGLANSYY